MTIATSQIKYYNETELAKLLGVSKKTLQKWRWLNKGPAYIKLGSRVVYKDDDIIAFVEANKRVSTKKTKRKGR